MLKTFVTNFWFLMETVMHFSQDSVINEKFKGTTFIANSHNTLYPKTGCPLKLSRAEPG